MKRSATIAYVESLGFSGVSFTRLTNYSDNRGQVCQLEFKAFDPKAVRVSLGRAVKHEENLFAFRLSRTQGVRVNTRINRVWLANGRQVVRKLMESI